MGIQKKYTKIALNLLLTAAIILAIIFLLPKIFVLFMPFIIGWLIAAIVNPLVKFAEKKLKLPRKIGSLIAIVLMVFLVGGLIYLISLRLFIEGQTFIRKLPDIYKMVKDELNLYLTKLNDFFRLVPPDFKETIDQTVSNLQTQGINFVKSMVPPTIHFAGSFVLGLPKTLIFTVITILSSYFISADREKLSALLKKILPAGFINNVSIMTRSLKSAIGGYVKAQLIILLFIFVIVFVGFSLLKIEYALFLALLISIFDAFPFFGTGAFLIPWGLYSLITGDIERGIGLLAIYGSVIITRQLIEPKIVGDNIGLHPLATLMSMYIGLKIIGVFGLILGPILLIILKNFYTAGVFNNLIDSVKSLAAEIKAGLS